MKKALLVLLPLFLISCDQKPDEESKPDPKILAENEALRNEVQDLKNANSMLTNQLEKMIKEPDPLMDITEQYRKMVLDYQKETAELRSKIKELEGDR